MSQLENDTSADVVQRLARLEDELRAAHAQIGTLTQWQAQEKRRVARAGRARYGLIGLGIAVAIGSLYLPMVTAKGKPSGAPAVKTAGSAKGLTVRGPLIVLDEAGKTVMRVQSASSVYSRGIFVFNPQGNIVAQATAASDGHGVLLARNGSSDNMVGPGAGIIFDDEGNAEFGMRGANGKRFIYLGTKGVQVINKSDNVVVNLRMGNRGGTMNLCDNEGNTMIEAGILATNRGVVRVFPMGGPASLTIPNYIMGAKPK